MVAAQLGTFLHALSHVRVSHPSVIGSSLGVAAQHDATGAEDLCLQCLAFAQVAAAAPGTPFFQAVAERASAVLPHFGRQLRVAAAFAFLARGPPHIV